MEAKLSTAKVKSLAVPEGEQNLFVWDTSLRGFDV
ncbi:hypothetical protein SIID45300_00081 [Candidatus Magnetaquicoccaceae bacterium FCR-1]|uniref:Uncharacterized protein n=1 Tax=Candidatus Magnetaquiglobus chichijimensis TaxID=3141448 RepID=A0ABQ0C4H6_9PROT